MIDWDAWLGQCGECRDVVTVDEAYEVAGEPGYYCGDCARDLDPEFDSSRLS